MKRNTVVMLHAPTEAEIQHAVYLLWIESGRPDGCDFNHWWAAKEMLCHRRGHDAKSRHRVLEIAAPPRSRRVKNN